MVRKAEAAQKRGIPVRSTMLSDVSSRYDVISIINVFSRVPDFARFLSELTRHLKPDGEVLIETGNGGDLRDSTEYPDLLYLPDHLVFAGIRHMHRFIEQGGFSVAAQREYRLDGLVRSAKNIVKRLMGKDAPLFLPYTSPFRTVFYRARLARR